MNLFPTVFITTISFKNWKFVPVGTPSFLCQLLHGRVLQGAMKCPHHPQCGSIRYLEPVSLQLRNKQHSPLGHLFVECFPALQRRSQNHVCF